MERPTVGKLFGEPNAKQINKPGAQGTIGPDIIQGNKRKGIEADDGSKEMKLGAYWEHNKHGVARGGQATDKADLKPINIRVQGIPNITTMAIGPLWTIEEVRSILARDSGLKHDDIDLYFGGDKLVIDLVASNCGILEDSIITAVLHTRG